jgi:hypothetical protein
LLEFLLEEMDSEADHVDCVIVAAAQTQIQR